MKLFNIVAERVSQTIQSLIPKQKAKTSHPITIEINLRQKNKTKNCKVSQTTEDCWVEAFITPEKVHPFGSPEFITPERVDAYESPTRSPVETKVLDRLQTDQKEPRSTNKETIPPTLPRSKSWHHPECVGCKSHEQRSRSFEEQPSSRRTGGFQEQGVLTTIPLINSSKAPSAAIPLVSSAQPSAEAPAAIVLEQAVAESAGAESMPKTCLMTKESYKARVEASQIPRKGTPVSKTPKPAISKSSNDVLKKVTSEVMPSDLHSTMFKRTSSRRSRRRRSTKRTKSQERMLVSMNIARTLAADSSGVLLVHPNHPDMDQRLRARLDQIEKAIATRSSVTVKG